ncbi:ras guanine nucleotide exchange factor R-like [Battus philenor]|uniref:ras guanine nucleotide exchange factor R-like n=1 Tax=Battus philenor TaxID=42288 RepID=UPI0035CF9F12
MRLTILLLIVGACIVTAKYLPNEWENSGQLLSRHKRSDSEESSEDEDDSNSNDGDNVPEQIQEKEQSKRIANMEKMRQKLLEKQEKERQRQEEAQRKLEEKIAKELQKEEEKRQKERRKQEERLEKERKKLEEEQKKIQEKLLENERKRQEQIQKDLKEMEKDTLSVQEDDSMKEFWKIHIYKKYGINETSSRIEKNAALKRFMQEELGLNSNSTEVERRKAILNLVQTKLQNVTEIGVLQTQLIDYINYVGVQRIRGKIQKDIDKLQNQTDLLNNINLTWVPNAKENIAARVSFLESIKQILSNVLPNWFNDNRAPENSSISNNSYITNINDTAEVSQVSYDTITSDSGSKDALQKTESNSVTNKEVTPNDLTNPSEVINNKSSVFTSSSIDVDLNKTSSTSIVNPVDEINVESETSNLASSTTNNPTSIAQSEISNNNQPSAVSNDITTASPAISDLAGELESSIVEIAKSKLDAAKSITNDLINIIIGSPSQADQISNTVTSNKPPSSEGTKNTVRTESVPNESDTLSNVSNTGAVNVDSNTSFTNGVEIQNSLPESGSSTPESSLISINFNKESSLNTATTNPANEIDIPNGNLSSTVINDTSNVEPSERSENNTLLVTSSSSVNEITSSPTTSSLNEGTASVNSEKNLINVIGDSISIKNQITSTENSIISLSSEGSLLVDIAVTEAAPEKNDSYAETSVKISDATAVNSITIDASLKESKNDIRPGGSSTTENSATVAHNNIETSSNISNSTNEVITAPEKNNDMGNTSVSLVNSSNKVDLSSPSYSSVVTDVTPKSVSEYYEQPQDIAREMKNVSANNEITNTVIGSNGIIESQNLNIGPKVEELNQTVLATEPTMVNEISYTEQPVIVNEVTSLSTGKIINSNTEQSIIEVIPKEVPTKENNEVNTLNTESTLVGTSLPVEPHAIIVDIAKQ